MALLGYARVSTSHQKLTLQVAELKSAGVTKHSTWNRNFLEWPECRVDAGLRTFSAGTLKLVS